MNKELLIQLRNYSKDVLYMNNNNIKEDMLLSKIDSIMNNKLEDVINKLNENDDIILNENNNYIDKLNLYLENIDNVNSTCVLESNDKVVQQIKNDIGINVNELEEYIQKYKKSINKYFLNTLNNEQIIYNKLTKFEEFKKFIKILESNYEVDNNNEHLKKTIENYYKYINEVCNLNDINDEIDNLNLNKECFKKLLKLVPDINTINILPKCVICLNNNVNKILLICNHTCCDHCLNSLYTNSYNNIKCPICRKTVKETKNIYYS